MGTPDFAVPSLKVLVEKDYDIAAVISAPDRPAGRGHKLRQSPVKEYALSQGLPVLQPLKLKDPQFLEELRALNANLQIVVAFRMMPRVVWSMPEIGTFNLHASLLPQYRGAAPINWAIINGEKETGLTTFFLKQKVDTGDLIAQVTEPILPEDNAGTLHDRLSEKGAQLVLETVRKIENDNYERIPQPDLPEGQLREAPKIFTETCQIDFSQPTAKVHDFVRGLSPYPAARIRLLGKNCKVFQTQVLPADTHLGSDIPTGDYLTDNKTYLHFRTADGFLAIEELQLAGKKRMPIEDFLRGNEL